MNTEETLERLVTIMREMADAMKETNSQVNKLLDLYQLMAQRLFKGEA